MIRVAAVGDLHCRVDSALELARRFQHINDEADVLVLAGDLTDFGQVDEARVLAEALSPIRIPIFAVLGNHDFHTNQVSDFIPLLQQAGVHLLEGEGQLIQINGTSLGIAGTKGFCGGFRGACGTDFGEPEMKAFMQTTQALANGLGSALEGLKRAGADHLLAVLHYAPIRETLAGERLELFPFLGSFLLAEPLDRLNVDLAVHGHAHRGFEFGQTPGGVPVRNVAKQVLKRNYAVYEIGAAKAEQSRATTSPGTTLSPCTL